MPSFKEDNVKAFRWKGSPQFSPDFGLLQTGDVVHFGGEKGAPGMNQHLEEVAQAWVDQGVAEWHEEPRVNAKKGKGHPPAGGLSEEE